MVVVELLDNLQLDDVGCRFSDLIHIVRDTLSASCVDEIFGGLICVSIPAVTVKLPATVGFYGYFIEFSERKNGISIRSVFMVLDAVFSS